MKRIAVILSLSLVVIATGCSVGVRGADGAPGESGKSASATASNFEILKQEGYGGRDKASNEVIDSQEELNNLYKGLNLTDAPKVDFKKQNVVALFMGQKSTGGYSIGISSVVVKNNIATVLVKRLEPAADAMVTNALTAPYCIAEIAKTDKVVFE
jgi:hypothetical protein